MSRHLLGGAQVCPKSLEALTVTSRVQCERITVMRNVSVLKMHEHVLSTGSLKGLRPYPVQVCSISTRIRHVSTRKDSCDNVFGHRCTLLSCLFFSPASTSAPSSRPGRGSGLDLPKSKTGSSILKELSCRWLVWYQAAKSSPEF